MAEKGEVAEDNDDKRTLFLPLEKLDKCTVCKQYDGKLRLCAACGEVIYCSPECQGIDWPAHKADCGKTDRINLESFYPFLAFLAESFRIHSALPPHIAQTHTILDFPNPNQPLVTFSDKSTANMILLGEEIKNEEGDAIGPPLSEPQELENWWPDADPHLRSVLCAKLRREGYAMPVLFSICISLMTDIYTTTAIRASASSDKKARKRIRLQYKKSPISDFGLLKCNARIPNSSRVAYFRPSDGPLESGPNPEDHFAIYFTALSGEEAIMDLNLYPFNFTTSVKNAGYTDCMPLDPSQSPLPSAPVLFIDMADVDKTPLVIQRKYSMLRNEVVQKAAINEWPRMNWRALAAVVESFSGKRARNDEVSVMECWSLDAAGSLNLMLARRLWEKWPAVPGVVDNNGDKWMEEETRVKVGWVEHVQNWCKRNGREVASWETLADAFRSYKERHRYSLESSRPPKF